ncbi:MAG: hypothetical protein ABID83_04665 [Candidatus Omnitrophota bacterium]
MKPKFYYKTTAFILMVVLLFSFSYAKPVLAQTASSAQQDPTAEEEAAWDKDLDKKIDTTIEVLKVIKEELKDEQKQDLTAQEKADWSAKLRKAISKVARIWKKVKKATEPETKAPQQTVADSADKTRWNQDMSAKLDKTIEIMKTMKEELDKIGEDDQTE